MERLLITGANGFVGSALCRPLQTKGRPLRGSVRSLNCRIPDGVEATAVGNIDGSTDWSACLAGVDAVVHCAARVHILREDAPDPLSAFRRVNVEGSVALARQALAAGVRRFVYLSSIGAAEAEKDPEGASAYQLSKLEAESELRSLSAGTAMSLIILRPPLVYGPGAPGNFQRLARLIATGLPLPLAAIDNRRSLLFIGNLTTAIEAALTTEAIPDGPLALSDSEAVSTPDLVRRMARASGMAPRLWPCPVWLLRLAGRILGKQATVEALTASLTIDNEPARKALGWTPPYSVEEGMAACFVKTVNGPKRPVPTAKR